MVESVPRRKVWRFSRLLTEHAFDKLWVIDCSLGEFGEALGAAEVIDEVALDGEQVKELLLLVEWIRPLHVVVVVDGRRREERIVTVYEPEADRWSSDYRRRR